MIVVAVTNVDWFKTLRGLPKIDVVNFWRPGSAELQGVTTWGAHGFLAGFANPEDRRIRHV